MIVSSCERLIGMGGGAGGIVFEGDCIGGGLYVHGFGECIVVGGETKHRSIVRVKRRVKETVVDEDWGTWLRIGWSFIEKEGVKP
jgi:hypothetical protein